MEAANIDNSPTLSIHKMKEIMGEQEFARVVSLMSPTEAEGLLYDWKSWARKEQLEPPGEWAVWLYLAGRGSGKTRSGSEWIKSRVEKRMAHRIALVGQSAADARDVLVEGESGILAVFKKSETPQYEPSKRRITFSTGAVATLYSAEDPDQLRGPSHDTALVDELAAYAHPDEVWSNLMFGLRLGDSRCMITTTPRPIKILKDLVKREAEGGVYVTRGSTYDNLKNLSKAFASEIISQYEGTRLGRQELMAEILDDIEGALWSRDVLDKNRRKEHPILKKICVSIDPSVTSSARSAETGIIVGGIDDKNHGYCLADLTLRGTPESWAKVACEAYHKFSADYILAEKNNGGELVKSIIRNKDKNIPIRLVWASRGKLTRAEPISALDEQGRIHLVGAFNKLEDELCTYDGTGTSPDRLDAYVWCFSSLITSNFSRGATWGRKRKRAS